MRFFIILFLGPGLLLLGTTIAANIDDVERDFNTKINKVSRDIKDIQGKIQGFSASKNKDKLSTLDQEVRKMDTDIANVKTSIKSLERTGGEKQKRKVADFEKQLFSLEDDITKLVDRPMFDNTKRQLNENMRKVEDDIIALKQSVRRVEGRSERGGGGGARGSIDDIITAVDREVDPIKNDMSALKLSYREMSSQMQELITKTDDSRVTGIEEKVSLVDEELEALGKTVDDLQGSVETLQSTDNRELVSAIEEQVSNLEESMSALQKSLEDQLGSLVGKDELNDRISTLSSGLSTFQESLQSLDTQVQDSSNENASARKEVDEKLENVQQSVSDITGSLSEGEEALKRKEDAQGELFENINLKIEGLENNLNGISASLATLASQSSVAEVSSNLGVKIGALEEGITEAAALIQNLHGELQTLSSEDDQEDAEFAATHQKLQEHVDGSIQRIEAKLQELSASISTLQSDAEAQKQLVTRVETLETKSTQTGATFQQTDSKIAAVNALLYENVEAVRKTEEAFSSRFETVNDKIKEHEGKFQAHEAFAEQLEKTTETLQLQDVKLGELGTKLEETDGTVLKLIAKMETGEFVKSECDEPEIGDGAKEDADGGAEKVAERPILEEALSHFSDDLKSFQSSTSDTITTIRTDVDVNQEAISAVESNLEILAAQVGGSGGEKSDQVEDQTIQAVQLQELREHIDEKTGAFDEVAEELRISFQELHGVVSGLSEPEGVQKIEVQATGLQGDAAAAFESDLSDFRETITGKLLDLESSGKETNETIKKLHTSVSICDETVTKLGIVDESVAELRSQLPGIQKNISKIERGAEVLKTEFSEQLAAHIVDVDTRFNDISQQVQEGSDHLEEVVNERLAAHTNDVNDDIVALTEKIDGKSSISLEDVEKSSRIFIDNSIQKILLKRFHSIDDQLVAAQADVEQLKTYIGRTEETEARFTAVENAFETLSRDLNKAVEYQKKYMDVNDDWRRDLEKQMKKVEAASNAGLNGYWNAFRECISPYTTAAHEAWNEFYAEHLSSFDAKKTYEDGLTASADYSQKFARWLQIKSQTGKKNVINFYETHQSTFDQIFEGVMPLIQQTTLSLQSFWTEGTIFYASSHKFMSSTFVELGVPEEGAPSLTTAVLFACIGGILVLFWLMCSECCNACTKKPTKKRKKHKKQKS